jgi:hypothetical protein
LFLKAEELHLSTLDMMARAFGEHDEATARQYVYLGRLYKVNILRSNIKLLP